MKNAKFFIKISMDAFFEQLAFWLSLIFSFD